MAPPTMRPGGLGDQTQDGQRGHAFAAAGFADNPQCLAGTDAVRDAVHRRDDPAGGEKVRPRLSTSRIGCVDDPMIAPDAARVASFCLNK